MVRATPRYAGKGEQKQACSGEAAGNGLRRAGAPHSRREAPCPQPGCGAGGDSSATVYTVGEKIAALRASPEGGKALAFASLGGRRCVLTTLGASCGLVRWLCGQRRRIRSRATDRMRSPGYASGRVLGNGNVQLLIVFIGLYIVINYAKLSTGYNDFTTFWV